MPLKDIVEPDHTPDDIDRIVDALLESPDRADDLKTLLRRKMTSPEVVHVMRALRAEPPAEDADTDEFWDNVPV